MDGDDVDEGLRKMVESGEAEVYTDEKGRTAYRLTAKGKAAAERLIGTMKGTAAGREILEAYRRGAKGDA